jgi:hypothetical protein
MPQVLLWLVIWFTVWILFNKVFKEKTTTAKGQIVISLFFFLPSVLVMKIFALSPKVLFFLLISLAASLVASGLYILLQSNKIIRTKHQPSIYLMAASFNVLFQQTMIYVLVNIFSSFALNYFQIILLTGLFFGFIHSPVLLLKNVDLRKENFILSIIGGVLFPYIILSFPFGIIYCYLIHFCYYLLKSLTVRNEASI